jgi:hypothetical protein
MALEELYVCVLDSTGYGQGTMAGYCGYRNGPSGSITGEKLLGQL